MNDFDAAIGDDASTTTTGLTEDQAVNALLDRWNEDAETPSKANAPEKRGSAEQDLGSEEHDSSGEPASDHAPPEDADDASTRDDATSTARYAEEDMVIRFKVDGEERQLSVKDAQKFAGLEYALTKKSEAVAEQRKAAEAKTAFLDKKMAASLERAEQRWREYESFDLVEAGADLAQGNITSAQYHALAAEMQERWNDVETARKENSEFRAVVEAEQIRAEQQRIHAAVQQITEKHGDVRELVGKLESYGASQGLRAEEMKGMLHPVWFEIMDKARRFDEAQAHKPDIRRVVAEPTRVLKPQTTAKNTNSADEAMRRARKSGSVDDAVEALLARRGNS